ncbi:hypothetical protein DY000_02014559 [Brassica cretica]|uniref:Protein FAR1-RELATED SEQUENCE n=1 Tax=Brassica cretica TaxID=69181 RepID=A0ABQ7D486_BRACR|nr:hypothetical protein DY000_02014559 [Brassica cretica]
MPVLQKSSQSASQEEAVEEMKDCRSITHHWCRSKVMPERGPSIFQDRFTPSYQNTHGRPDILPILSPSFDTRYSFELTFQCHQFKVNQHPVAEVMPVLQKSSQSASQEEAVEEMKDCRSITHHWCRSKVMPERGPSIFQDRFTPSYQNTHGRPDILPMYF